MSLNFSIETLESKKNILFTVIEELKKDSEVDHQEEIQAQQSKLDDIEKALKILNAASL